MKKGSVSAGIVTYNNASEIVPCLNSLIECTKDMDVDIYVFDNCSQDETVPVIANIFRGFMSLKAGKTWDLDGDIMRF